MSEQITIGGRQITVRPLTMRQIRDVLDALKDDGKGEKRAHIIDVVFNDEVPAVAVSSATGLSLAELEGEFGQQEIRELLDKVRAVNPFFVGMMERLVSQVTLSAPSPIQSAG